MQTITPEKLDIKVSHISSPVPLSKAWQIESFLLRTFEYGDYSFRKALAGRLSDRLQSVFFTVQNNCNILAVVASLYSMDNPAVAIFGPVCADPEHQRKGLAFGVCSKLLEYLKAQGVQAVYLGVRDNTAAENLYQKLGFEHYNGIVMRKLFVNKNVFDQRYSSNLQTVIRRIDWEDFAEVSALLCESGRMSRFDFEGLPFLAAPEKIERFLPVFPGLMNTLEKNGGCGSILQTKGYSSIAGIAFIRACSAETHSHIAFLDFFVLDGFEHSAKELVSETIKQFSLSSHQMILCACPDSDIHKKQILLSLDAKPYANLSGFVEIDNNVEDMTLFRL